MEEGEDNPSFAPPKYKIRQVSAVRDFPEGFKRLPRDFDLKPKRDEICASKIDSDVGLKPKRDEICVSGRDSGKPVEIDQVSIENDVESERKPEVVYVELEAEHQIGKEQESSYGGENVFSQKEKSGYQHSEGLSSRSLPKRRKVSAIRDFPKAIMQLRAQNGVIKNALISDVTSLRAAQDGYDESKDGIELSETEVNERKDSVSDNSRNVRKETFLRADHEDVQSDAELEEADIAMSLRAAQDGYDESEDESELSETEVTEKNSNSGEINGASPHNERQEPYFRADHEDLQSDAELLAESEEADTVKSLRGAQGHDDESEDEIEISETEVNEKKDSISGATNYVSDSPRADHEDLQSDAELLAELEEADIAPSLRGAREDYDESEDEIELFETEMNEKKDSNSGEIDGLSDNSHYVSQETFRRADHQEQSDADLTAELEEADITSEFGIEQFRDPNIVGSIDCANSEELKYDINDIEFHGQFEQLNGPYLVTEVREHDRLGSRPTISGTCHGTLPKRRKVSAIRDFPIAIQQLRARNELSNKSLMPGGAAKNLSGNLGNGYDLEDGVEPSKTDSQYGTQDSIGTKLTRVDHGMTEAAGSVKNEERRELNNKSTDDEETGSTRTKPRGSRKKENARIV